MLLRCPQKLWVFVRSHQTLPPIQLPLQLPTTESLHFQLPLQLLLLQKLHIGLRVASRHGAVSLRLSLGGVEKVGFSSATDTGDNRG